MMRDATSPSESARPEAVRQEPGWLRELRAQGRERAASLPFPTGREEAWRYTDVGLFGEAEYDTLGPEVRRDEARAAPAVSLSDEVFGGEAACRAYVADGLERGIVLCEVAEKAGVRLLGLREAYREEPGLVEEHLGRLVGPTDRFTARSLALHRDGLVLTVPEGVTIEEPFVLPQVLLAAGAEVHWRLLVLLGRGASIRIREPLWSPALAAPSLVRPVSELFLGPESRLEWISWQDWGRAVRHHQQVRARLEAGAELTTLVASLGAGFSRTELGVTLAGAGARSRLFGVSLPTEEQHVEHWTVQDHQAPDTKSDLLYKGAVSGAAHSIYYGTIRIGGEARRSDAYQASRNLMLSPEARVDANPQLEIETNEVRCTHGVTAGRLDPEQLFYLTSRGVPYAEAAKLLVSGFVGEVIARTSWSEGPERIRAAVARLPEVSR